MKDKLWNDLVSHKERLEFLKNGRAVETGIVAPAMVDDLIKLYQYVINHKGGR